MEDIPKSKKILSFMTSIITGIEYKIQVFIKTLILYLEEIKLRVLEFCLKF